MIIYNVTIKINHDVHDEWKNWMITKHIPDVMATGMFLEYRMSKILLETDDAEGVNYSIQYLCENRDKLNEYQDKYSKKLQEEHTLKYKNKFFAFRTFLEIIAQQLLE